MYRDIIIFEYIAIGNIYRDILEYIDTGYLYRDIIILEYKDTGYTYIQVNKENSFMNAQILIL